MTPNATMPPEPEVKEPLPANVYEIKVEDEPVEEEAGRAELRDFFSMIGGLGARARKQYQRVLPVRIRSRRGLVVASLTISLTALAVRSWASRPPAEMPPELQGAWTTTTPDYADLGFWIGKHQVAFKVGPKRDDITIFPVRHLTVSRTRGDTTWYVIQYAVDKGVNNWSVRHVSLPHPAIVFVHQPRMTWTVKPDLNSPAH